MRVTANPHGVALVTVLRTAMETFVPQQLSEAMGGSNVRSVPWGIVLLGAQVRTGGTVSEAVTV